VGLHADLLEACAAGSITQPQAAFTVPVVLHGGYENPLNLLGLLVLQASEDIERFRRHAASDRVHLIEETLRTAGAVHRVVRWWAEDVPERGARRGDAVWLNLARANHNLGNGKGKHLASGWGHHRCPGVHLAHFLSELVIDVLLALPRTAVADAVVTTRHGLATRAVTRIELEPRTVDRC
jgi:cytochrome P450